MKVAREGRGFRLKEFGFHHLGSWEPLEVSDDRMGAIDSVFLNVHLAVPARLVKGRIRLCFAAGCFWKLNGPGHQFFKMLW